MNPLPNIKKKLEAILPDVEFSSKRGNEYNFVAWCSQGDSKEIIQKIKQAFDKTEIGGCISSNKRQLLIAVYPKPSWDK